MMPQISSFIQNNLDVVFFVYGLSFIALALVTLVQPREKSRHELAKFIWLLVVFGFVHGVQEWMHFWMIIRGNNPVLEIWRVAFLFLSYAFLFEFGRRLMLATPVPNLARTLLGKRIYSLVMLGFLIEFSMIPDWMVATSVASRYFLCFTGATMVGAGFLLYFNKNIEQQAAATELPWAKKYFVLAAIAFLLYGVLGGLVVPSADVFPGNIINYQWFFSTFQMPVQLFRAVCAVLATIAVGNILRVFHEEARKRLQTLLAVADERTRELAESEAHLREITSTMGEGLYVIDGKGRILFSNPEAQRLLGWTEKELMNQDAHQLFHYKKAKNEPYPSEECGITKVVGSGQIYRSEEEVFWRKNGSPFNVEVCSSPIIREGGIVSSVTAFSDITERKRSEEHIRRLLDENRALAIHLSQVEEEERKYLARELHDEAGQWLTATQAYAHAVFNLSEEGNGAIHANIQRVINSVAKAHHAISNVIRDLRPGMLDELGLTHGLRELARLWRQQNPGVALELGLEGDLDNLDNMIKITIYRIIQEGLTNAAKYAEAHNVNVRVLRTAEDELILSVVDDGKGMDLADHTEGFGLRGIRERAIALGGELTISALPGKGVHIEARLKSTI